MPEESDYITRDIELRETIYFINVYIKNEIDEEEEDMVKRLLAFVLSAVMVIETPVTVLAVEQMSVAVEEDNEEEAIDEYSADETENEADVSEVTDSTEGYIGEADNTETETFETQKTGITDVIFKPLWEKEDGTDDNYVNGAYDFVRGFKVAAVEDEDGVKADLSEHIYYLNLYVKEGGLPQEGEEYDVAYEGWRIENYTVEKNEDESVSAFDFTVESAKLIQELSVDGNCLLRPETTYSLKWILTQEVGAGEDGEPEVEELGANEETFNTKAANIEFVDLAIEEVGISGDYDYTSYTFQIDFNAVEYGGSGDLDRILGRGITPKFDLAVYLRENDALEEKFEGVVDKETGEFKKVEFNNPEKPAIGTIKFISRELKSDTTYDIVLKSADEDGYEYITKTEAFKTRKPGIGDVEIDPGFDDAYFAITIKDIGGKDQRYPYLLLYYKSDNEGVIDEEIDEAWNLAYCVRANDNGVFDHVIRGLKPNTKYDYIIGFGDSATTPVSGLEKASKKSGNFTTKEKEIIDNRSITNISYVIRLNSALFSYQVNGVTDYDGGNDSYVVLLYREAGTDDEYSRVYTNVTPNGDGPGSLQIKELDFDTEYEYIIGITGDKEATGKAGFVHCKSGTFKTESEDVDEPEIDDDSRSITDVKINITQSDSIYSAYISLVFNNPKGIDSDIHFFYKKKGEGAWNEFDTIYTCHDEIDVNACINNLNSDTKYYLGIGVTKWGEGLYRPEYATVYYISEFETPIPEGLEPSTGVTLSQENIYLSVNGHNNDGTGGIDTSKYLANGYDYQIIKATVEPASTKGRFRVVSDNTDVADVIKSGDYIYVYARGIGNANIVFKSYDTDNELTRCTVEVEDYKIIMKEPDSAYQYNVTNENNVYKRYGISRETYHLYNGTQDVKDYTVSSRNENIASYDSTHNQIRTGCNLGTTQIAFTAGNYKTPLYVKTITDFKGAAITGLHNVDEGNNIIDKYKAIADGDNNYVVAAGSCYAPQIELGPYDNRWASDFTWSKNSIIVDIDSNSGKITTYSGKTGRATITATAKPGYGYPNGFKMSFTIVVRDLPDTEVLEVPIYALVNVASKLSDVTCPNGWEWKEPDTPLVTNKNDGYSYYFNVVNTESAKYYPIEFKVCIYMAKVTGIALGANVSDGVIEVSSSADAQNADILTLSVNINYEGLLNVEKKTDGYQGYEIFIPEVAGLDIKTAASEDGKSQKFDIVATRAGNYTLKPVIRVSSGKGYKNLAQAAYKIKAVAGPLVSDIKITAQETKGVTTDEYVRNRIYVDKVSAYEVNPATTENVDTIVVNAELTDRLGNKDTLKDTKLTWKTSDAKVAKVTVDPADSHKATIKVTGEGHAVLTATAKDTPGRVGVLNVEIRNYAPRISTSSVTVNMAYDYQNSSGLSLANAASGAVEVVPVYGENLSESDITIYEGAKESENLRIYSYNTNYSSNNYVIGPKVKDEKPVNASSGEFKLHVETGQRDSKRIFEYPLKVTVINKNPKVTIKASKAVNLFYKLDRPEVTVKISDGASISSLTWTDNANKANDGFSSVWNLTGSTKSGDGIYCAAQEENIVLTNKNKLADTRVAKGTFKVKLSGYRDEIESSQITLKYNYKKPKLVTKSASTTVVPSVKDCNENSLYIYNNTDKRYLDDSRVYEYDHDSYKKYYYESLTCDNSNAVVESHLASYTNSDDYDYSYVAYTYKGSATKSEKITLTLKSSAWREDLTTVHTIKMSTPVAVLSRSQITINTNEASVVSTNIYLKNNNCVMSCDAVDIVGKDDESDALLERDLLEIIHNSDTDYAYSVTVVHNRKKTMGEAIVPGTYTYNLTPYYTDITGKRKAMNTLTLNVKVVNRAVTAKVKLKGSLDLLKGALNNNNYMTVTNTFNNIGTNYSYSQRLVGEYADYFYLSGDRLYISESGTLKAKQKYKLAIEYTIYRYGLYGEILDRHTITSNTFTVIPKQSTPKVTVVKGDDNQIIYAGAENDLYKKYRLSVTSPYRIDDAYGSIDCNKDGEADIIVSYINDYDYEYGYRYWVTVEVVNRDAVLTTTGTKGKTYSIPVTVELRGRDGVSKDAKATIKITVKR